MVLKCSKKGVYSGNTLRASNSRYNRLYRSHSSIVRRFVANTDQPKTRIQALADIFDLSAFDVEFSLNKKERWGLPESIRKQIQNLEDDEDATKTDLLVRHKLKRQANCVAYYANRGLLKRLVPKCGRYFDGKTATNFKASPSEKERKALRGESMEETVQLENTIRYEVIIPCSPYSSIVHNPKYIKPELCSEDESTSFGGGKKKKKRTRLTSKVIDELLEYNDPRNDFEDDSETNVVDSDVADDRPRGTFTLRDFLKPKHKFKRKSQHRLSRKSDESENKKHRRLVVVDVNVGKQEVDPSVVNEAVDVQSTIQHTAVHQVAVKIRTEEITFDSLQTVYGPRYAEARCEPRKFSIDVTEKIQEHVRYSKHFRDITSASLDLSCYLTFSELRACPIDSQSVYNIGLNLATNMKSVKLENLLEMQVYSINDLIEKTKNYIDMLPRETFLKYDISNRYCHPIMEFHLVGKAKKWNVDCFHPEEITCRIPYLDKENTDIVNCEFPAELCTICYDEISTDPETSSLLAPATCLSACGHWFCNRCWRDYLLNQLRRGASQFTCPEYECRACVDFASLLSFLHVSDIKKHTVRQEGEKVNCSPSALWCPVPKCGRAIQVKGNKPKSQAPKSVVCNCGIDLCFSCEKNAHWPATCAQAKRFRYKVIALDDYITLPKDMFIDPLPLALVVNGKSCPKCKRFIEKISGCPNMRCPCGCTFCWCCLNPIAPYEQHKCDTKSQVEIVIGDEVIEGIDRTGVKRTPFYVSALEHRKMRMYSKFCKYRSRAVNIARRLALIYRESVVQKQICKLNLGVDDQPMSNKLCKFLVHMVGIKLELHHVAEHVCIAMDDMPSCGIRLKLHACVSRIQSFISEIEAALEITPANDLRLVLDRLREVEKNAQRTVNNISKLL